MAAWPNCRQLQPPRSMAEDTFQCEEFKIRSFLSTLKGRAAVGFPADAETIERWPLVQAHALEEMGMGGFLTQKHKVTSIADAVRDALSYVDAHSFDCLVKLNVDMLAFHWRSVALQLDKPKTPWRRLDLTQADVGEPLESYFEFGDMQASAGASKTKGRGARVLFGTRTDDTDEDASDSATIGSSGVHGRPAVHFTVEGDDAVSGIRAARTYMLSSLTTAAIPERPDVATDDDEEDDYEAELRRGAAETAAETARGDVASSDEGVAAAAADREDGKLLVSMYAILCAGLRMLIGRGAGRDGLALLKQLVGDDLNACWKDATRNLVMEVSDFGTNGGASEANPRRHLRYVRISLAGIPSSHPGAPSLGQLVVGDTLCISGSAGASGASAFNMTGGAIPYLRSWVCGREEGQCVVDLRTAVLSP